MTEEEIKPKAKPGPKSAKKKGLEALKAAKVTSKKDVVNPPKFKEVGGRDYSNANMREFLNTDRLKNYDFRGAKLVGADFTGMIVQGCKFNGADLTDTVFYDADLRWSDFSGSNAEDAYFAIANEDTGLAERGANIKETKGL